MAGLGGHEVVHAELAGLDLLVQALPFVVQTLAGTADAPMADRILRLLFLLFLILSLPMAWQASSLRIDAAFDRSQPERHPFSLVDRQYRSQFGGASPLRIAMTTTAGDTVKVSVPDTVTVTTQQEISLADLEAGKNARGVILF